MRITMYFIVYQLLQTQFGPIVWKYIHSSQVVYKTKTNPCTLVLHLIEKIAEKLFLLHHCEKWIEKNILEYHELCLNKCRFQLIPEQL